MSFERKYYYNENYFHTIDSSEKAYWVGSFYADGYITKTNRFGCGLNIKDQEHLIKFLNTIGCSTLALRYDEKLKSYKFELYHQKLVKDLQQLGFTNHKSYDNTDIIFQNIPELYKIDFIRGLWDGDGYVSKLSQGNKGTNATGVISNNEKLLNTISKYINNHFGDETFCKVTKTDGYPRIRLRAAKAYKFCYWIYKDAIVYLDRKYENFLNFNKPYNWNRLYKHIKLLPSKHYFVDITNPEGNHEIIGTFNTVKEAVDAYNKMALQYGRPIQKYVGEDLLIKE